MTRRASLPGASELFRRTSSPAVDIPEPAVSIVEETAAEEEVGQQRLFQPEKARGGSPRQKHDAKITVYVSGDELLAMEQARLTLRGSHDLVVDRGRLVREAVAVLLADFSQHGADSVLVRRLRDGAVDGEQVGT